MSPMRVFQMKSDSPMVIAVILARGGSKGIPRKNLQSVGGVSLLGRAIRAALGAESVTTVLVSTDDREIRAEAERFGAEVVERPRHLAGDLVSSEAALMDAIQQWEQVCSRRYRVVALVQATSPFTKPQDIDRTIEPILAGDADSALTVVDDYGYFWFNGEDGWNLRYQTRGRRQDRMSWKRESGNVYAVRYDLFMKTAELFPGRVQAVTVPMESCHEIDEPRELEIARALHEHYASRS